mgnify:CR=1 FL=1
MAVASLPAYEYLALNLLEAVRAHSPEATFIFTSTNKVYGDAPNRIALRELPTRWDYADPDYSHGIAETFTVRKLSFGVGVERTFPVHSPVIDHIEIVTRGDVRRAKLYYLRDLRGKKAKIKEKRES